MRIGIGLLVVGAVIGGIVTYRHHEVAAVTPPAVKTPNSSLAPPRLTSEHDWAKGALDRAADVKRQVSEQKKENDQY